MGSLSIQYFKIELALSRWAWLNLEKSIKIFVSSGTHISSQIRKLSKAENLLSKLKLESIENFTGKMTSS